MGNSKVKTLGDRMKEYEDVSNTKLTKRTPVIVRIDGKAFHTYTRGFDKPFDKDLSFIFEMVCRDLVENVQGCKLAYTQSDEISLLLTDWDDINTDSFFDYRVQKMTSVLASMTTAYFNRDLEIMLDVINKTKESERAQKLSKKKYQAMFDARVFNLPKEEVCNYFIWRQQDASRNSVQSLGRSKYSAKQMNKKSNEEVQEMLFQDYGINWNNTPTKFKRGFCVFRDNGILTDLDIPIFTQDRRYIERFLEVSE